MKELEGIKMKFYIKWVLSLLLVFIVSCKGGGDKFSALDASNKDLTTAPTIVSISSFTPNTNPVNLTSTSTTTFGVSLVESDSSVIFSFLLDGSVALQSGSSSFYNLAASGLTAGNHTLKVTASNSISSDSHTFDIVVNSPTVITSFTPTLTGANIACGLATPLIISAAYSEINTSDTVNIKWYLNNNLVSMGNANATVTNDPSNSTALVSFNPSCDITGINFIRLDLNDGHEITTKTWTVNVTAPITIHIADSIPTIDPVVLTATTSATFGVTLTTADSTANFNFILDNSIPVQNDHRTYTSLSGAGLSTGLHTLKVIASNTNSNDTHTFNIRKNAPPTISSSSPAASGTLVDCGSAPIALSADMADANSDSLSYTWLVDDSSSPYLNPSSSGNHTQASFNPSCLISGTRVIKAVVNDGYESTTVTWSVTVRPAAAVTVGSFTPITVPTVITNAQTVTFGITLTVTDPDVAYTFSIKNLSTGLSSSLYTGSSPFYNLIGSSLAAGSYELKARASNGTYSDEHIFVVRKNSPPAVPPIPLTFSPALTGTTIICGTNSQLFQSAISDADSDSMTVTWKLNGVTGAANFVNTSSASEAKVTYTPSCAEVGVKTISVDVYDGFETTSKSWTVNVVTPIVISISSVTPTDNPINLASVSTTTFGVTLATADPSATYRFVLDTTTVQNTTSSFYNLSTTGLTPGAHTLKVTAQNATSSDEHVFNIVVNIPASIISFAPNLNELSLSCGITNANISALYDDANATDSLSVKWYLNNSQINFGNANANLLNDPSNKIAMVNYHPTCAQAGINFIKLEIFDGHEYTTQTWTVMVTAPITILISEFLPSSDPTILTGATSATFGVTLATPDSTANYTFVLDSTNTVQNSKKTFYNLAGSGLSVGTHTLVVTAYNATSSASKTFNIRKNSPPSYTAFSPAFSGTSVNCGATPITLYADMVDANGDTLTYQWLVDDAPSAYITPANSGNRVQASFTPNCAIAGSRVVKAIVSDGNESVTLSWNIAIASPIAVHITGFIPSTNPTILKATDSTTFGVALASSDANVTYNFVLRNLTTLVSTTLQSGSVPFYTLVASGVSAGTHELTVTASNGTSSDSKVFSLRKNSPPAFGTTSPALTGIVLNCGSSSQLFQTAISDADSDIMSATWSLNGVSGVANIAEANSQILAKGTYTPTCAEVGTQTIKVEVTDSFEKSSKTWTVTVINPTIVNIGSYSPNSDPVSILSTGSQVFSVSATGKAPLTYEWKLDGSLLAAATTTYTTITAASLSTGPHTLVAKVSDSDSNQSKTFNIIKNAPPELSGTLPSNLSPKININTVIQFSGSFTDANGDAMTVTWLLNGAAVSAGNANASVLSTASTSVLTFTPSPARLGDNTLVLQVSDGKEMVTKSWNLNVNYFSDTCNNMGAGKACTIIGQPGRSSNIVVATDPSKVMIRPVWMENYVTPAGVKTSSLFFTDDYSHVVWFYNKNASPISLFGQTIGAGVLKAVIGVGQSGAGVTATPWNDFALSAPRGLAWDYVNQRLFIADESNNRVVMLANSGIVTTILNNSVGNTTIGNGNNANALTSSWCQTPRGLQYNPATKLLYVACYNSWTVRSVDTTNANSALWTSSIVSGSSPAGTNAAASTDGTNGYGGTNQFYNPTTLKLDTANNVLYVSDIGHCKIKAINMSGSTLSYFGGAYTIPAGSTGTIFGMTGTAPTYGTNASRCGGNFTTGGTMSNGVISLAPPANGFATAQVNGGTFMSMELNMSGSTLLGFFVSDYNQHRIGYVNNTASSVTIGNSIVPSYSMNVIWGGNGNIPGGGTAGYLDCATNASGIGCYVWNPATMNIYNNKLYLADYNNKRIRTLDLSTTNGAVAAELGYISKAGFAGNGGTSSENVQFNMPTNLYFEPYSGKLLVSDFYNYRIRALNLNTGRIDGYISAGPGAANISQADPSAVYMYGPRSIVNYNNHIIYTDNQNNNCLVRAWNTMASTQTILGVSTFANAVQTIAGNYINACGAWDPTATTGNHINARLQNPQGITTDGSNLYFANTNQHCIIKVDQNGNMSTFSGLCNASGVANSTGIAYNDATVRYNLPTAVVADPRAPYTTAGNLFILDQTTSGTSRIRYINQYNSAVTIYGTIVAPGQIKTIFTAADNHGADLAINDYWVCFSSGGNFNYSWNSFSSNSNHNVVCLDRDDGLATHIVRFGRNPSNFNSHGYLQEDQEEEGLPGTSISLAGPAGLAFDSNGNLYISERDGHDIRMIKKWW